jgi:hypothetical protein
MNGSSHQGRQGGGYAIGPITGGDGTRHLWKDGDGVGRDDIQSFEQGRRDTLTKILFDGPCSLI